MSAAAQRPPFWRDVRVLGWVFQLAVFAVVVAIIGVLVNNVRVNSANQGIPTGFSFLDQPSSFEIPGNDFRQTQPVREAIVEGVLNTLRVVIAGLILATLLGVTLGVGRLSGNFLIRTITRVYVETIRNIPLLGLLIFFYIGLVLTAFPRVEDSWVVSNVLVANVRGVTIPWITGSTIAFLIVLAVAVGLAWAVNRWRLQVNERTGEPARGGTWAIPVFVLVGFWGAFFVGTGITTPELDGRSLDGGMTMQPEYFALLLALVIYTASHIAEIVRGAIQAVPKGQVEAASALALSNWHRLRHIVLPQALRIAVPPIGNQYLNLMKNSSLGFVISYFEVTKTVQTTVGNRSPAVPAFLLLIGIYLVMSLIISAGVNVVNRRLQVVER
ncbi:MAG: ABC transporter permease subunit [Actinomycetota bacterium]